MSTLGAPTADHFRGHFVVVAGVVRGIGDSNVEIGDSSALDAAAGRRRAKQAAAAIRQ